MTDHNIGIPGGTLQKQSLRSVKKLQAYIRRSHFDAFFVSDLSNVTYLTTFSGTSGTCLMFSDSAYFFTDFRYETQAGAEVVSCGTMIFSGDLFDYIARKFFIKSGAKKFVVGVEDSLSIRCLYEAGAEIDKLQTRENRTGTRKACLDKIKT